MSDLAHVARLTSATSSCPRCDTNSGDTWKKPTANRKWLKSAKGAARTTKLARSGFAPRSVLREFLKRKVAQNDECNQFPFGCVRVFRRNWRSSLQEDFSRVAGDVEAWSPQCPG